MPKNNSKTRHQYPRRRSGLAYNNPTVATVKNHEYINLKLKSYINASILHISTFTKQALSFLSRLSKAIGNLLSTIFALIIVFFRPLALFIKRKYDAIDENKITLKNEKIQFGLMFIAVVLIMTGAHYANAAYRASHAAWTVTLNGEQIAITKDRDEFRSIVADIEWNMSLDNNVKMQMDGDFRYEPTFASFEETTTKDELESIIKAQCGNWCYGYALYVNNIMAGVLRNKTEAANVLERIKSIYTTNEDSSSYIAEKISIRPEKINLASLVRESDLVDVLIDIQSLPMTHAIETGESFATIAEMYDVNPTVLKRLNPSVDPENPQIGQNVALRTPQPKLTVFTTRDIEYDQEIIYPTKVEHNAEMYKNKQQVKVHGVNGLSKVQAQLVLRNGEVSNKSIVSETVVQAPVEKVIIQGTKDLPPTMATGNFSTPTRGYVSSGFGFRWGRLHKGVDIANRVGTPIYAADAGRVRFAGWRNSYGYMIEIDHENGYVTKYAHLSKLHVSSGSRVHKLQHIGNMGSTGNSTGSHLHFEVLQYGNPVNPKKFIP